MHSPRDKEKLGYGEQETDPRDRKSRGLTKLFHLEVSVKEAQLSIPLSVIHM